MQKKQTDHSGVGFLLTVVAGIAVILLYGKDRHESVQSVWFNSALVLVGSADEEQETKGSGARHRHQAAFRHLSHRTVS